MNAAFGQPSFGSTQGNPFASGSNNAPSAFGTPSFGGANNAPSTGPGKTESQNSSSAFGQPVFGQPTFGSSSFSQQTTNIQTPAFGQPSFGANATFNSQAPFGQVSTGSSNIAPGSANKAFSSPFGSTVGNSNPTPFGQTFNKTTQAGSGNNLSPFGSIKPNTSAATSGNSISFGQAGNNPSPFAQNANASPFTQSNSNPSPFAQTANSSPFAQSNQKPSPFAKTSNTSPFNQTNNKPSPFDQSANNPPSLASTTTTLDIKNASKPLPLSQSATTIGQTKEISSQSIFSKPTTNESTDKPSIFSKPNTTMNSEKSNIFATEIRDESAKNSLLKNFNAKIEKTEEPQKANSGLFGNKININKTHSTTSIFGQSVTKTPPKEEAKNVNLDLNSMSINKEETTPKKTAASPVKSVSTSRGLSGATPTKKSLQTSVETIRKDSVEESIASKLQISKPSVPAKPTLEFKGLEHLKNPKKKMTVVPPSVENVFKNKHFKAVNSAVNTDTFANNMVSNFRALGDEYSSVLLQERLNQFHIDASYVLSCTHRNGNSLVIKSGVAMKISSSERKVDIKTTSFEPFSPCLNGWFFEYNGDDLVLFYRNDTNNNLFVLDIARGKVITLKTKLANSIKKLRWHPLANNSIIVLMTLKDHKLYQLDIWTSKLLQISEKLLGLTKACSSQDKLSNIFSNLKIESSIQFKNVTNFEVSTNGWKLYLLDTVLNDIYIINPFLPFTGYIKTREETLTKLREIHEILKDEEGISSDVVDAGLSFLNDKNWFYKKSDTLFYLDATLESRLNMGLQGPISFNKFPAKLYDKNIKDMKIITTDDDELELIVLLFDSGDIITLLESGNEILFWNQWNMTVFDNTAVNKFIHLEDSSNVSIKLKEFSKDDFEDGLLAYDSNGRKCLLSFIDYMCKLEGFFATGDKSVLNGNFKISKVLELDSNQDYIITINEQYIGRVSSGNLKILPYPTLKYIQSKLFLSKLNVKTEITALNVKKGVNPKPIITYNNLSHDSVNFFKSQLDAVSKSIKNSNLLRETSSSVKATKLENLLGSFPDETMPIASTLAQSMEQNLSSIKLLQELFLKTITSQERDFQLRMSELAKMKPVFYSLKEKIEPNNEKYDRLIANWENKLIKLQSLKAKLKNVEEETIKSEPINIISPGYYEVIDDQIKQVEGILQEFEKAKLCQEFLKHKLESTLSGITEVSRGSAVDDEDGDDNVLKTETDFLSAVVN